MLDSANWAPTHGLTEPWRFVVFTGKGLSKLGEYQASLYKQITPVTEFKQTKYDKLVQRPMLASHVIALGMIRQPSQKIPLIEEIASVACAVQNMMLTATAYGVATYWTTGGITYAEEAKPYFGLHNPEDRLMGFLYVGFAKDEWPSGTRRPIDEKIRWVRE